MKSTKWLLALGLLLALLAPRAPVCWSGDAEQDHPKGARRPTAEEKAAFDRIATPIKAIRLNHIGLERINAERRKNNLRELSEAEAAVAPVGREIVSASEPENGTDSQMVSFTGATLPTYVNNSLLPYFPPIRTQNGGSCACFSTTYYQMTYMTAMTRSWNVTDPNNNADKFSPGWTYNMLNGGSSANGTWTGTALQIQLDHGAATWEQLDPGPPCTAWATTSAVWLSAIGYRMNQTGEVDSVSTSAGLAQVKALLNNGYVLNFSTDIDGWKFKAIQHDPASTDDMPFVGLQACYYCDNAPSGHSMTVVGYNDDIWVDVNGNGVVDPGEKGALLIANNWGTTWENAGFVWLSYDALKAVSGVTGGPTNAREQAFWYDQVLWITARTSYTPKLLAQFTCNTANRSALYLQLETSNGGTTQYANTAMLQYDGGAFGFGGTSTACDATFVFDFSDLAPAPGTTQSYTLVTNISGTPTVTLKDFRLIDVYHAGNVQTVFSPVPQIVGNGSYQSYNATVTYDFAGNVPPVAVAGPTILARDWNLQGYQTVTLSGSGSYDPDGTIASYVWTEGGTQLATGETAQVSFAVGVHTVTLTVTDNQGATASTTMLVKVYQTTPQTGPVVLPTDAVADNCSAGSTGASCNSSFIYFAYPYVGQRVPFMRWSLPIPPGSTVNSANVTITSNGTAANQNPSTVQVQLVNLDNCPSFSVSNPYSDGLVGPTVNWTVPGVWSPGATATSPDLTAVVQDFVNRPGYAEGNYLGLCFTFVSGSWKEVYLRYAALETSPVLTVVYTPPVALISVSAALDYGWVYQNAPQSTSNSHSSVLTITIPPGGDPNGNTSYTSAVTVSPSGAVTVAATSNPLLWTVTGGQRGVGPVGPVTLNITVHGVDQGGQGSTTAALTVQLLGDINNNGAVTTADRVLLNKWLNGQPTPGLTARNFDLSGNGNLAGAGHTLLNTILDGLPVP